MKKLFQSLVSLLCAGALCLSFVGCEDQSGAYSVTVAESRYGEGTVRASADAGDVVTVDVDAERGYAVQAIYVDGQKIQGNSFPMPARDVVVSISYTSLAEGAYSVNVQADENGALIADLAKANEGDTVTLQFFPAYNRMLSKYEVDGTAIEGNTFQMPAKDVSVTARTEKPIADNALSLSVTTSYYEATSYWMARYLENGLEVKAIVDDPILYTSHELQPTVGYHDNIEFIVSYSDTSDYTANDIKVLVTAAGDYYVQFYSNGWQTTGDSGITISANYCTLQTHGFNGYEVTVLISYSRIGQTYQSAQGNLAICPAMRNTTAYYHSNFACYSELNCSWDNPLTHPVLGADGTFHSVFAKAERLVVSDGLLATAEGGVLKSLFNNTFTVTEYNQTTAYWKENIDVIAEFEPTEVLFSCGTTDLVNMSPLRAFIDFREFYEVFQEKVDCTLTVVSAIPTISALADPNAVVAYNGMVEEFIEEQTGVRFVDLCSHFYRGGVLNQTFYASSTTTLSDTGNALLFNVLRENYGASVQGDVSQTWGNAGDFITIGAWNHVGDTLSITTGGVNRIYYKNFSGQDFVFKAKLTVTGHYNGDQYPKFGMFAAGQAAVRYCFIYADGLTKKNAGSVVRDYMGYHWEDTKETPVANLSYTNGDYADFTMAKSGNSIVFKLGDSVVYRGSCSELDGQDLTIGLFSFNLGMTAKEWSVQTDAQSIEEAIAQ